MAATAERKRLHSWIARWVKTEKSKGLWSSGTEKSPAWWFGTAAAAAAAPVWFCWWLKKRRPRRGLGRTIQAAVSSSLFLRGAFEDDGAIVETETILREDRHGHGAIREPQSRCILLRVVRCIIILRSVVAALGLALGSRAGGRLYGGRKPTASRPHYLCVWQYLF